MTYRSPTKEEIEIGLKAAKARGIDGRDQVKWAVDMWHIHIGRDTKPSGWEDPYAATHKLKPSSKGPLA